MSRAIVFTFGRMNPVTSGHERLINEVLEIAKQKDAEHLIVMSQTTDDDANPFDWYEKLYIFVQCFPNVNLCKDIDIKTPYQALEILGETYDDITFVCGSDRVDTFKSMKNYAPEKFEIVSSGERDRTLTEGIESVSASRAREFVINNDYNGFKSQMPSTMHHVLATQVFEMLKEKYAGRIRESDKDSNIITENT